VSHLHVLITVRNNYLIQCDMNTCLCLSIIKKMYVDLKAPAKKSGNIGLHGVSQSNCVKTITCKEGFFDGEKVQHEITENNSLPLNAAPQSVDVDAPEFARAGVEGGTSVHELKVVSNHVIAREPGLLQAEPAVI